MPPRVADEPCHGRTRVKIRENGNKFAPIKKISWSTRRSCAHTTLGLGSRSASRGRSVPSRPVSSQRRATVKSSSFVPRTAGSLSPPVADGVDSLSKQEATSSRAKVPPTHRLEAKIATPDGRGHSKTTPSSTRMLSTPTHDLVTHFQALRRA